MPTSLLLLSTDTRWIGPMRAPKALAGAGFEVHLLAPRGSLIEKSRFVAKVGHLPDNADAAQWVFALAAMVKAVAPRLLMPCDDMAYRLMCALCLSPPPGLQPALHAALAALIRESLGDPAHYLDSIDKVLFPPLAESLGAPIAAWQSIGALDEARQFVARHGYPVALKRSHSTGGTGVWLCGNDAELEQAHAEASRATLSALQSDVPGTLLIQVGVEGHRAFYPVAAWKGEVLGGYASEALVTNPPPKGPATVVRRYRDPEMRAIAERIVRGLGASGILAFEFIVDDATGKRYVLEINRRMVPGLHTGARIRLDLYAALRAAIEVLPSPTRADFDEGEESINVHFPQEWLRDPNSRWLREHPVDVPWDEPELIEALLALRHGE
jgi:hypothetical protein